MKNPLLKEVEAFLKRTGMAPTTFGEVVMADPTFVFKLREGRDSKMSTYVKVLNYIEKNSKKTAA